MPSAPPVAYLVQSIAGSALATVLLVDVQPPQGAVDVRLFHCDGRVIGGSQQLVDTTFPITQIVLPVRTCDCLGVVCRQRHQLRRVRRGC